MTWHRHVWHSTGDRWTCACGAWVLELRRGDGTIVALPKPVV